MKLINIDEDIPKQYFIFVNHFNPMTEHNFRINKIFTSGAYISCMDNNFMMKYIEGSAKYLPYEPCQHDYISPSPYFLTAINDYRIEYDAEVFRERYFPLYPSRLSALYAFGDFESCEIVSQKYNWDLNSVRKFKLDDWPLTRIAKVNMEHVSLAKHAYRVSSLQEIERLWQGYWTGFGEIILELPSSPNFTRRLFNSGIIWEYLIEGIVHLIEE